ncbi:MAG: EF-hand domain-containing protein [Sphingomonadaceae bacterium]
MGRYLAGVASALLLVAAGFFLWQGDAVQEADPVPPAPGPTAEQLLEEAAPPPVAKAPPDPLPDPPEAPEKTREQKRFARYDKNEDGRITRAEMMSTRVSSWKRLDKNGDNYLTFEEWAVTTGDKFAKADADRSGALTPAEFATTRRKTRPKKKCAC